MSMAAWPRRFSAVVVSLLLGATAVMADPNADAQRHIDAMLAEPLATTSPASLSMANYMLTKTFNRGVDDLDSYAYLLKLLIQHTLDLAERDAEQAAAYRLAALAMTYNLATNTWAGWGPGEVGTVTANHRRLGLAAARRNVELAAQLKLGPGRRRNGYWALGAQLLAAGDYDGAVTAFATSSALSREAELASAALMAQGWIHLANALAGEDQASQLARLEAVKEELRGLDEDGAFYADQYGVALAVFRADD